MKRKTEYWTLFEYGSTEFLTICSKHRSEAAARRAARECERRGGAIHEFVKVIHLPRKKENA